MSDTLSCRHYQYQLSGALGLLAADRLKGGERRVIAVIGDGALTGGLAYEALSHTGQLGLAHNTSNRALKNIGGPKRNYSGRAFHA